MTKSKVFVRTPYNYDMAKVSRETSQDFSEDCPENMDKAVQSAKEECDINTIVKRFGLTGHLPTAVVAPSYAQFEDVFDYQTAMNALVAAQNSFNQMPADVRARFGNDPHQFVEFCSDAKNLDEMRKMGLAVPEKEVIIPPPTKVVIVEEGDGTATVGVGVGAKAPKVPKGGSGADK